jgi:hypothetical protein
VSNNLKTLSRGPTKIARSFSGYVINGYKFHPKQRDARHKTQNSSVTLAAITKSFSTTKDENPTTQSITYYGLITQIVEVDYYGKLRLVLFRCDWFEVKEEKYGMTCVYINKRCYEDDPFVLASQVHQCFYIQDPSDANKHYVMKSVPRYFFNMNEQSDLDHGVNLATSDEIRDDEFVRNDIPPTIVDNLVHVPNVIEFDDNSNGNARF